MRIILQYIISINNTLESVCISDKEYSAILYNIEKLSFLIYEQSRELRIITESEKIQ